MIRSAILAALLFAAPFAASACNTDKATGQTVCVYPGAENGWQASLQFATIDGAPFLIVNTAADTRRIEPTEVIFRIEGGELFRLPVHSSRFASNCVMGVLLVGSCLPLGTVNVQLDTAIMDKLAAAERTYITAANGNSTAHPVKLKGRQMRAWLARFQRAPGATPGDTAAAD